jgi:xylose dehydrogenase (NAD/NADP)
MITRHDQATLKWGLLSTARINRRLIPAIREAERVELVAVASRDGARAEAYAAEWDIPRAHEGYEALLEDPEIDVIYISFPNNLHTEWTVKAAQAGKHVLCEKPLALTVDECDHIIAAAKSAGVVVVEAFMYLHHPLLHKARELVRDGAVGQVKLVRGAFSFFLDRPTDVRWQPELGGGSLWDVGGYPVSFIRWIAGEPDQVFGWQILSESRVDCASVPDLVADQKERQQSGVDATFAGLLRYADGVLGLFDCGFRGQFRVQAEVVGAEGALTIERPYIVNSESHLVLHRDNEEKVIALPQADPYRCEIEALTAAVLDGATLPLPLSSSRANVVTLMALYESARRGTPVKITNTRWHF